MSTTQSGLSLEQWQRTVGALENEVAAWSQKHGWKTNQVIQVPIFDEVYGPYAMPVLTIEAPEGRLVLEPMAHAFDRTGLIKLYAWPTLYRVRLLDRGGSLGWEVLTDSGIPLHQDWNEQTFIRLAQDLLKADY